MKITIEVDTRTSMIEQLEDETIIIRRHEEPLAAPAIDLSGLHALVSEHAATAPDPLTHLREHVARLREGEVSRLTTRDFAYCLKLAGAIITAEELDRLLAELERDGEMVRGRRPGEWVVS